MPNSLVGSYNVYVGDWWLIDSSGNGLFNYFSSPSTFDDASIYGANPENNYAGRSLLLYFANSLTAYNYLKKLRLLSLRVNTKGAGASSPNIYLTPILSNFSKYDENQPITFATTYVNAAASSQGGTVTAKLTQNLAIVQNSIQYGLFLSGDGVLSLRDSTVVAEYVSPYAIRTDSRSPSNRASGNINDIIAFSWGLSIDTSQADNPKTSNLVSTVSNYKLYWRDASTSGDGILLYSGTEPSYTAPANTFDGHSTIQWRVVGTMTNDVSINPYPYSDYDDPDDGWFTLNLAEMDAKSTCNIVRPNNVSVDGSSPIPFQWQHVISTGTAQTKADIQTGVDSQSLSTFATVEGAANTYTAPANSFAAGDLYWRVRTYNADGIAGEWSETAHIIVISASPAPLLSLERISPRPVIRWEAQGQIAFELEIMGVESASQYGQTTRYEANTILSNGNYTVRVRVQNKYSLWSPWAEAALPVTNSPSGSISLSALAAANGDVSLSWTQGAFTGYEVLRDGAVIARTAQTAYTDRLAVGPVQYQVRGIVDAAGNYSLSNAVALTVSVRTVQIAPVSGGDWLALPYTTTDIREVATSVSRAVTYQQFLGAQLPTATVSEALTISHQLSTAFPWSQKQGADRLEYMIGQLVCVKDPRGERFVGVLGSYSKTSSRFYIAYSLTITPVDWEEATT